MASSDPFPLPLTAMELYLWLDETPDSPMSTFIELHFDGSLDRERFRRAFQATVAAHPLLSSRIVPVGERLFWQHDPGWSPQLRDPAVDPIVPEDAGGRRRIGRIDLLADPGIRCWYEATPQASRVTVQIHHACSDGIGLRQFLIELLLRYDQSYRDAGDDRCQGDADKTTTRQQRLLRPCDPNDLIERGRFDAINARPIANPESTWQKLRNAYYFHLQRPSPLKSLGPAPETPAGTRPLRTRVIDPESSARILQRCQNAGLNVNDLALALLLRVCRDWNERTGVDHPGTRLRLSMPIDLRDRSDRGLSAANRMSLAFLGRTHRQVDPWDDLLKTVAAETQHIKTSRVHMDFLNGLTALADHPQWFRRMVRWHRNMTTCVLTYGGDVSRGLATVFPTVDDSLQIGDVRLTSILGAPPTRPNTHFGIGLNRFQGCLSIAINHHRGVMTSADVDQFIAAYVTAWEHWGHTGT